MKDKYQIFHRDIKPANVLMKQSKLKLTDFGESKKIE